MIYVLHVQEVVDGQVELLHQVGFERLRPLLSFEVFFIILLHFLLVLVVVLVNQLSFFDQYLLWRLLVLRLDDQVGGIVLVLLLWIDHRGLVIVLLVDLLLVFRCQDVLWLLLVELCHHMERSRNGRLVAFMVLRRLWLLLVGLPLELLLLLKHLLRLLHLLLLQQMLIDQLPRQLLRAIHHHVAVVFDGRWRKYLDILLEILQRLARLSDHVSVHKAQQLQNEEVLVD